MTFTINLTPEETHRVQSAQRKGIDIMALFKGLIAALPADSSLPVLENKIESRIEDKTLELLAQWRGEDATQDTEELERRDVELDEFKVAIQSNRLSLPVPEV